MFRLKYPNALIFQSWGRAVRTAAPSVCEKLEQARTLFFFVESKDASVDAHSISDNDSHLAFGAKLAVALMTIVKERLGRRLAVMVETLAKHGYLLREGRILFRSYLESGKD